MKRAITPPFRIVTGGQTGVDRAALDAALNAGVPCGGWCPAGRRAEDGRIPHRYPLRETPSGAYEQRTRWNVRDSDGTLIIAQGPLTGGTAYTAQVAAVLGRPLRVVAPGPSAVGAVVDWCRVEAIRVLNIAGPRASEDPGLETPTAALLAGVLDGLSRRSGGGRT